MGRIPGENLWEMEAFVKKFLVSTSRTKKVFMVDIGMLRAAVAEAQGGIPIPLTKEQKAQVRYVESLLRKELMWLSSRSLIESYRIRQESSLKRSILVCHELQTCPIATVRIEALQSRVATPLHNVMLEIIKKR